MPSILPMIYFGLVVAKGFKPCYKWNAFNTQNISTVGGYEELVLNLVINGMPSILNMSITPVRGDDVLNLVINGMPSILDKTINCLNSFIVLNLVINGMPSILNTYTLTSLVIEF